MKPIRFLGDSLTRVREFDPDAKQDVGYQLDKYTAVSNPMILRPCLQLVKELKKLEFGMNRERIV